MTVIEANLPSIAAVPAGTGHTTVGGGAHRRSPAGGEVDALVRPEEVQDGVEANAETGTHPGRDRPHQAFILQGFVRVDPTAARAGPAQQLKDRPSVTAFGPGKQFRCR